MARNMEEDIDFVQLAKQVMQEKGLEPNYSLRTLDEVNGISAPAKKPDNAEDLRALKWCSIDNDDSEDLDQLTYAERTDDGKSYTIWVAIADVDALVKKDSAIDNHASINTTSVYTPAKVFSMLPEKLSTNLTSLNEGEDRAAVVVTMTFDEKGEILASGIFQAFVHNHAKLTYHRVGAWLEGKGEIPEKVPKVPKLEDSLRIQYEISSILSQKRHDLGALTLETIETRAKINKLKEIKLETEGHNAANQIIEEFMIAANTTMATFLKSVNIPSLRRVVRKPKYWDRIVELANEYGFELPVEPDSVALDLFLIQRFEEDPETFPDLSLSVIKLLGRGEYVVELGSGASIGHFGLALKNYTHSTAPNRRFPDLVTQRQFKAHLRRVTLPYSFKELEILAEHCTKQEDAATKVERHMAKSAAAQVLSDEIGREFDGIVTGATNKGTFVRIFTPAIEGKVVRGGGHLRVGDRVVVTLIGVDIPKGFIDFKAEN